MIKKHYYSWQDIEDMCSNIVKQMYKDHFHPDYILGITRGGNIPATIISNMLDIPCEAMKVSFRNDSRQESHWLKDIADEKSMEEQVKDLENQIAEAKKELEEIRLNEEQAYVIRFKRIKDKDRMVVIFRNKHDADMYADNIKKMGGQVFSNKLERVPLNIKLKSEEMNLDETITAVKNKAKKTGMPYSILKQVYNRGMAAWKGGHRPGATQQQWALARVNSFVTKSSGTWGGADKDLAAKVRGSKK